MSTTGSIENKKKNTTTAFVYKQQQQDEDEIDLNYDDDDDVRKIYIRIKLGMIDINDVDQQYRPDVDIFFYYAASEEDKKDLGHTVKKKNKKIHYFQNLMKVDGEWPFWTPHFDFDSEVEVALVTDESYWLSHDDDGKIYIFGRVNMVPKLQNRINHTAFPYDRQILFVELLSNNCLFERWNRDNDCPHELKLFYDQWHIQGELNSLADTWDLDRVRIKIEQSNPFDRNNSEGALSLSSKANLFMYIQREPEYYTYNISLMLFFIVLLNCWIVNFPFDESRFDFALNLVLTQIAFRFVISNIVPRTSYLMYLDKYMQIGFILLVVRFIVDWGQILIFTIPSVQAGDDFRCVWKINSEFSLVDQPSICKSDFYITLILMGLWTVASVCFLFPNNWRRRWSNVEDAVEEDRLLENTFYEKRRTTAKGSKDKNDDDFCRRQLFDNREKSIGRWLKDHDKNTSFMGGLKASVTSTLSNNNCDASIEKPFDILECRKMFFSKTKKSFFCSLFRCKKEDGMGRGCKELRGWTEPSAATNAGRKNQKGKNKY